MKESQILPVALASVPTMLAVLVGILINNYRLGDLRSDMNARLGEMSARLGDMSSRIDDLRSDMDARFDDLRATWQSELRRVKEVIDARLKHLEER